MDILKSIEVDLEKGFSKSDLERLIGLPKNSLSGILKGNKKLSRKSELKIQKWNKSDKPSPLEIVFTKPTPKSFDGGKTDRTKIDEAGKWVDKKEIPEPPKSGKEYFDQQMAKSEPEIPTENTEEIQRQLKEWQNKKCPSYMSLDVFKKMQAKEIEELQKKLK